MKGYLQSKGIKVSENKVATSLKRVAPESYQRRRQNTLDRVNPVQYAALYFGHKLHIDQNEKLKMYGMTRGSERWVLRKRLSALSLCLSKATR